MSPPSTMQGVSVTLPPFFAIFGHRELNTPLPIAITVFLKIAAPLARILKRMVLTSVKS